MQFITELRKLKTKYLEDSNKKNDQPINLKKSLQFANQSANVRYSLALFNSNNNLKNADRKKNDLLSDSIELNNRVGKKISFRFTGRIICIQCGRKTNKSFQQGYCFPCFKRLPQTDLCMVKPELCHFHKGTCRDEKWGKTNCFIKHTIYLATTSNLKVGITRSYQQKNRWIDQGASSALPLGYVDNRLHSGVLELSLKKNYSDKTIWSKMLFSTNNQINLLAEKEKIHQNFQPEKYSKEIHFIKEKNPLIYHFHYPILELPKAKKSYNLEKDKLVEDYLMGIKGQYLLFPSGVFNLRKHSGYEVEVNFS